jgi:voltage-gated potassium channel Kch
MASYKRRITFSDRLRYGFDKSMSAGTIALIGWLALISLIFIIVAAIVLTISGISPEGGEKLSFPEATWQSMMRAMDAGSVAGDAGWSFRLVMFIVTIAGIFIVSSLIGVLTSGLESKMDELRKGRSFVIEQDHTLILGWSSNIFTVISELVVANSNQKNPRIVVMADKDKVEMEEEVRSKVGPTGRTQVICRTGSPIDLYDLEIVNPQEAKSIIILSPESDNPDSQVIKTILAITNNPRRREAPYHIVAVISDPSNMEAAQLVSRNEAQLVQANDLIARITVQTCRQSGMSVVYTELLDYEGDEIYFQEEPTLIGKTFGEALLAYEDCVLMGLQFANGRVQLNPPMETRLQAGDKIIAIAEDDDRVKPSLTGPDIQTGLIRHAQTSATKPERTLILGWNRRGSTIISELDSYVAPGSIVTVVAESDAVQNAIERLRPSLRNLSVEFQEGNTTDRSTLDALQIPDYQHVIALGYTDTLDAQEADARTLITLLHLRNIEQSSGVSLSIVSEMLDVRNRELAEVTQADDFIVSDKLISLLLAQVSENKDLNAVFSDLFDSAGSEIYMKAAGDYVMPGQPVNFYTVVEAARQRNEVAIGYRLMEFSSDVEKQYGVKVNPKKSTAVTFNQDDRIIVLAES